MKNIYILFLITLLANSCTNTEKNNNLNEEVDILKKRYDSLNELQNNILLSDSIKANN